MIAVGLRSCANFFLQPFTKTVGTNQPFLPRKNYVVANEDVASLLLWVRRFNDKNCHCVVYPHWASIAAPAVLYSASDVNQF
jgi:hypothetical protein